MEHSSIFLLLMLLLIQGMIGWRRSVQNERSADFMNLKVNAIEKLHRSHFELESIKADLIRYRSTLPQRPTNDAHPLDEQIKNLDSRLAEIRTHLKECADMDRMTIADLNRLGTFTQCAHQQQRFTAEIRELHSYYRSLAF